MRRLASLLALTLCLAACDSGPGASLYDPDAPSGAAPVISSVTPSGVVLAGIDVVVIEGQNFSATPGDNVVVFDDTRGNAATGTVLTATATRLEVRTPNLPNPALRLRVAVRGAEDYSNPVPFPLTPAFVSFGDIARTEIPYGIIADADGTLYVSLENEGRSVGIVEIAPDGARSTYFTSTFTWPSLARAGGRLFGVRNVRALFELPEGGSQRVVTAFQPTSLALAAVATTADGTLFAGGNAPTLFRVSPTGAASQVDFPTEIRALAVGGSTLYVVGVGPSGGPGDLYAVPLGADGAPGAPAVRATLPAVGNAVAVATDGTVFVGLQRVVDPIVTVSPAGVVAPLYPGILTGPASALAYGAGSQLFMVRPFFNNQRADLLRIETRREGAR